MKRVELCFASFLSVISVACLAIGVGAQPAEVWGTAHNGLEMSISGTSGQDVRVSLRNVSKHDLMLNIGMMLAPGVTSTIGGKSKFVASEKYQYADAIRLVLVDAVGKATELSLFGPPGVAGTLEPFAVPLPSGATYDIKTPLSDYCDPKTFKPLGKGAVKLSAKFKCRDAGSVANRSFWSGSVESNTVALKL